MIDAMKRALEALELIQTDVDWQLNSPTRKFCRKAEIALRQAIKKAEKQEADEWYEKALWGEKQEPVCWLKETCSFGGGYEQAIWGDKNGFPVYTVPPRKEHEQDLNVGIDVTEDGTSLVIRRGDEIIKYEFYEAPRKEWVGLTDEDKKRYDLERVPEWVLIIVEAILRKKNT